MKMLPRRLQALPDFVRALSIRTKAFAALAVLLSCFAALGINSYLTMRTTSATLGVLRTQMLPEVAVAMDISNDIIATHMKVFRFVTLASNGVTRKLLDPLYTEILSELSGETIRLRLLTEHRGGFETGKRELVPITTKWGEYASGVKDLLDVGRTDAPMAVMMLGATDEDFQTIASHLNAMSSQINERTSSLASDILISVNANKLWLAFGGAAGMIVSMFVAMGLANSLVKPIVAVTQAMRQVSSGAVDFEVGYHDRKDEIGQMVEAISTFRRTTQLHAETILLQSRRFDVALNNISHGVCMFDADGTLIVRNNRYLEIYRVPPGSMEPGCTLRDVVQILGAGGLVSGDQEKYFADLRSVLADGESTETTSELSDGRNVHVSNQPMPGGGWVATHEDVTERIRNDRRVADMARHDILTGLPNRFYFRERTEAALPLLRREESFAVLCIDLDNFKEVNDTLGHPCGDALLKLVADRLRKNVRETDILARLGGDEFAVVQTVAQELEEVTNLARRIVEVVSAPYLVDGHEVVVGASIGVAIAPGDGTDPDELLKKADMAMYRAKADGRGMVRFFEAEMDARIQARHRLETELRMAVTRGEFVVHYQPIVNLKTNRVAAFEALVRWNHPERGLVMPDGFISVAEDIGLISPIGEWVLRQACAEAATWPQGIRLAVNLSPSQFRRPLVPPVVQALVTSGLSASCLELEITESALLQDSETTLSTLRELHDMGVSISMDDFGTGYSSLSYLHSFPFDRIKIDRSFVSGLGESQNCAAIVKAVTGLGRTLGMKTTAEGVETRGQLEWLRSEGCTEAQGYLYSRPQPAKDLAMLISRIDHQSADQRNAA